MNEEIIEEIKDDLYYRISIVISQLDQKDKREVVQLLIENLVDTYELRKQDIYFSYN